MEAMFLIRRTTLGLLLLSACCLLALSFSTTVHAALPDGFVQETVVGDLFLPTTFDFAPDGRMFIAEKNGTVKVFKNGQLLPTPFITLGDINTAGDRGLIGLTLDPDFSSNGWVYLSYTYESNAGDYEGPKTGKVVRVKAVGDVADTSTMETLVGTVVGNPSAPSCKNFPAGSDCIYSDSLSHSVGGLRFGPDGYLYVELGDGAGFESVDPAALNSQDIDSLAGKMLRINRDGSAPSGNPYYDGDPFSNRSRVFSYGHRNSYRFNFRPSTGALYAGEVGWGAWEEINILYAGGNYGWPCREGSHPEVGYQCQTSGPGFVVDPMYEYSRQVDAAAVVGGDFTGSAFPAEYQDNYIFGDFHRNQISRMVVDENDNFQFTEVWLDGNADGPVAIITGPDGAIYYIAIFTGEIRKISYAPSGTSGDPDAFITADTFEGTVPLTVNFDGSGSFDQETSIASYSWTFGTGASDEGAEVSHTYEEPGTYSVILTVVDTEGNFDSEQVTIIALPEGSTGAPAPSFVSAEVTPAPIVVGNTVTFDALLANAPSAGTDPFIVDFEIYDAGTGEQVHQEFVSISLANGASSISSFTWVPNLSGTYFMSIGLFTDDWGELYEWIDQYVTVEVGDRLLGSAGSENEENEPEVPQEPEPSTEPEEEIEEPQEEEPTIEETPEPITVERSKRPKEPRVPREKRRRGER